MSSNRGNKSKRDLSNTTTSGRDGDLILEFQHESKEIEDLIKKSILEYHNTIRTSQVLNRLVTEWRALHKRITRVEITDEQFYTTTEIGKFITSHAVFDDLEKML